MSSANRPRVTVHGSAIIPGPACLPFGAMIESAVLLLGESGSGKSDVVLRLIAMGARLLADDQVVLSAKSGRLHADAPDRGRGHIEIRGIGIVKLPAAQSAPVLFCVGLTQSRPDRLPEVEFYQPSGLALADKPRIFRLRGLDASAPVKIAAAAAAIAIGSLLPEDGSFL